MMASQPFLEPNLQYGSGATIAVHVTVAATGDDLRAAIEDCGARDELAQRIPTPRM
jgi:hypothetical protein